MPLIQYEPVSATGRHQVDPPVSVRCRRFVVIILRVIMCVAANVTSVGRSRQSLSMICDFLEVYRTVWNQSLKSIHVASASRDAVGRD
jgi:hypothetical protein